LLLLVGLPFGLALSGDPHLSVTTFASLENFNFSSVVACDIPFGEVCEAFSLVLQNWTKASRKLDQHPEIQPKNQQKPRPTSSKSAWLFFTTDLRQG
jgi:hypothetical protein